MYKHYIKQAWNLLKENRFYSFIYILGTAFTISMVMLILTTYHIKTAGFRPEDKRDRMLYVTSGRISSKETGEYAGGANVSLPVLKECYYSLESAEKVTAVIPFFPVVVNVPGSDEFFYRDRLATDAAFWDVFSFGFLEGKPFDEADFQGGLHKVVVSERMARALYNTVEVTGRTIEVNKVAYDICGVVPAVSTLAEHAFADLWVPYSSTEQADYIYDGDRILGPFQVYILAPDKKAFSSIRDEVQRKVAIFNSATKDCDYDLEGQPDILLAQYLRKSSNQTVDLNAVIKKYGMVIFFLLLIPAINISGLIVSRMKKRESELAVRKAFGASSANVISQILIENFLVVCLGGLVGLVFSSLLIGVMDRFFLVSSYSVTFVSGLSAPDISMLFNPVTFLYVFLVCLALNLLSAFLPAWRTTRIPIVNALKNSL